MNEGWYGALKEAIQQQQNQLVWVSEGKVRNNMFEEKQQNCFYERISVLSVLLVLHLWAVTCGMKFFFFPPHFNRVKI